MRIVTAANSKYIDYLVRQVRACKEHLGVAPDVFDLGLSKHHRFFLATLGASTGGKVVFPGRSLGYPGDYSPRALFKPGILRDYCRWHPDEDVLYLDADAYPVAPFEFPCSGLGLTAVDPSVMKEYEGTDLYEYVGPYHSGVMFLGASPERDDFIVRWREDMYRDHLPSDKKSLNRVVAGMVFDRLDAAEWNARAQMPFTKIVHDQGLKRDIHNVWLD